MELETLFAVLLITLHGPNNQRIDINPDTIVSTRKPLERSETYFHPDTRCILNMNNGKILQVTETCDQVKAAIDERNKSP